MFRSWLIVAHCWHRRVHLTDNFASNLSIALIRVNFFQKAVGVSLFVLSTSAYRSLSRQAVGNATVCLLYVTYLELKFMRCAKLAHHHYELS